MMSRIISALIVGIVIAGFSAPSGYCELFKKNEKTTKGKAVKISKEAAKSESPANGVEPLKELDVKPATAAEAIDPRIQQIPGKLQAIEAQQKNVSILESRLAAEKKQLEDMQKDFAINFKVDLEKLKSGKVHWDEKKKSLEV